MAIARRGCVAWIAHCGPPFAWRDVNSPAGSSTQEVFRDRPESPISADATRREASYCLLAQ
jgi:hypothetical protein